MLPLILVIVKLFKFLSRMEFRSILETNAEILQFNKLQTKKYKA